MAIRMQAARELHTARLRLRQWRPSDELAIAAINEDPEVRRYLGRSIRPMATGSFYASVADHWERHGFGFWAAESTEPERAGALLGFIGFGYPTFLPTLADQVEIGWRLSRRSWGRGLATEGATAARDHAFEVLGLGELISIIHPENARSRRVATQLGMEVFERVRHPGLGRDVDVWRITAPPAASSTRGKPA